MEYPAERTRTTASVLLDTRGMTRGGTEPGYGEHEFHVPEGAGELRLYLTYTDAMLFVSLLDPKGFRGSVMRPGVQGRVTLSMAIGRTEASPGALPGPLQPGLWQVLVDYGEDCARTEYHLLVVASEGGEVYTDARPGEDVRSVAIPQAHEINHSPGWYRGELHSHTDHSDGKASAGSVAQAAEASDLDFISLTDHYTVSGWTPMRAALTGRTLLIRGCEVTSRRGHANLHGLDGPADIFVDRPGHSMNRLADEIHGRGGLFCVNHAFSGDLGWRIEEFDWSKADMMEVLHALEGPHNNGQLALWDHHLRLGRRLIGVAGTDSHHPTAGAHALGRLTSRVYCDELSERGVLDGLRRGLVVATFGPDVRLAATDGRFTAQMWESLPASDREIELQVAVTHELPVRVFLLKNGYPCSQRDLATPGETSCVFRDTPRAPCYYRVEVHGEFPGESGDAPAWITRSRRDYRSVLAVTNPVLLGSPGSGSDPNDHR